jgi:hypothetical protein
MVNLCDEELIGKTVKDGDLEMHISPDYFEGKRVTPKEAINLIRRSQIVNLAGSRIVRKTLDAKLASPLAVKKIGSAHFLMIFKFKS